MIQLRIMLPEGEEEFRKYIHALRQNSRAPYPNLNAEPYSKECSFHVEVGETEVFRLKEDLAKYLDDTFKKYSVTREDVISAGKGLWTWLAYIWVDQLTNNKQNILKRDEHYICTDPSNYRRYYIHLVAPPYIIYSRYKECQQPIWKLFLYNPPWEINDFTERVAANQFLISHPNVIEAIYHLYFDENSNRPKTNATSRNVRGNVRRFIKVFQHLELTYDMYSLESQQIIDLLPDEFNAWK